MSEELDQSHIGKYLCESNQNNRKKNVMITVRRDLLQIARQNRVNLSKLLESSLIQLIDAQTDTQINTTPFLSAGSFAKESAVVLRPGFEPGSVAREATILGPLGV